MLFIRWAIFKNVLLDFTTRLYGYFDVFKSTLPAQNVKKFQISENLMELCVEKSFFKRIFSDFVRQVWKRKKK